jgi:hypothetical protein
MNANQYQHEAMRRLRHASMFQIPRPNKHHVPRADAQIAKPSVSSLLKHMGCADRLRFLFEFWRFSVIRCLLSKSRVQKFHSWELPTVLAGGIDQGKGKLQSPGDKTPFVWSGFFGVG